jgi:uncharacterized protein YjbI with pentapeptide repeats
VWCRLSRTDWLVIVVCLSFIVAALSLLPALAGWAVAGVVAALIAIGGAFWLRSSSKQDTPAELGRLLMFGLAAALPSLLISHAIENRQRGLERALAARQRAQDLQLQVGFQSSLAGVDLRGRDLSGFELRGKDFTGADLERARLAGADLRGARLSRARLDGATLEGADLTDAHLDGATLAGARLDGAKLFSADLRGACFARRNAQHERFPPAELRHARLAGAFMKNADFAGADLRATWFTEDLRDARNIDRAVFVGADVRAATWPYGFEVQTDPGEPPRQNAQLASHLPGSVKNDVVVKVLDGDTVLLKNLGAAELSGVDAPNVDDPSGLGGRSGALGFAQRALPPRTPVFYQGVLGPNGHARDVFGRTFVYLWRAAAHVAGHQRRWLLFNQQIVAQGYAKPSQAIIAERASSHAATDPIRQQIIASSEPAKRAAYRVWSICYAS